MDRPGAIVRLPREVREPFTVYVNGVRQAAGVDYEVRGGELRFAEPLSKAEKLGFWRWLIGAFGIGTYGRDDQVDVAWDAGGRPQVAQGLDIEPGP